MPPETKLQVLNTPDTTTCLPPERLKRSRNWVDHEIDAMLRWLEDPVNYAKTVKFSGHREEEWMSEMAQYIPTKTVRQICDRFHRHRQFWNLATRKNFLPGWGVKANDDDSCPDVIYKKQALNNICKYFWRVDAIFSPSRNPLTKLAAQRDIVVKQEQSDCTDQSNVAAPGTTLDNAHPPKSVTGSNDTASGGLKLNTTTTTWPIDTNSNEPRLTITPTQSSLSGYPLIGIGSSPHRIKQTIEEIRRENAAHKELLNKGSSSPTIVQNRPGTGSNTSFPVPEVSIGNPIDKIQGLSGRQTPTIPSAAKNKSASQLPKSNNPFKQNSAAPYTPRNPIHTNSCGTQPEHRETAKNVQDRTTHHSSGSHKGNTNTPNAQPEYREGAKSQAQPIPSRHCSYYGDMSKQNAQSANREKAKNAQDQARRYSTRSHQGHSNTQPAQPAQPEYRERAKNQDPPAHCSSQSHHGSTDKQNFQAEHRERAKNDQDQTQPRPLEHFVPPRHTLKPLQDTPATIPSTPGMKRPAPDTPAEPSRISRPRLESPQSRPAAPTIISERQTQPYTPLVQPKQPSSHTIEQARPTYIDIRKYEMDKDYELKMKKLDIELYLGKKRLQLEERRIELEERKLKLQLQQLHAKVFEVEHQRQAGGFLERDTDVI
ncbi:hypothetical protein FPQ18DRAFT_303866 [Pyronema domesticum]|nr:hypothetical protein FPQ18DRAFT_303866 [Pyronema domesticum]